MQAAPDINSSTGSIRARVAIVGAGPSGTATALRLSQAGVRDVVLLDAHDFPRDKTCGSALSPRGVSLLKELGIWDGIAEKAYPIHGIRIVGRGGNEASLSAGDSVESVILLRRYLDHEVLKAALARGIEFIPNFRAHKPIVHGGRWTGIQARDGREVHADYVVVANGAHSGFVIDQRPKKHIRTIMGWWENVPFQPHVLEMVFDELVAPLYGWLFPEGPNRVNIGITYEDDERDLNARQRFDAFVDKHYRTRLTHATQIGALKGHPISYTYRIAQLHSPGRVIVGEAGRMTHPATGEGIYQGMRSGTFAADALVKILDGRASESTAMREYQRRCSRTFTPSFVAGGVFRHVIRTPALDWVLSATKKPGLQNLSARVLAWI